MSEQLEALKDVAERLEAAGAAYMVTGSIAVSYYAIPRFTRDIDIVIELERSGVERLAEVLGDEFFVDAEALGRAVERAGMVNVIHRRLLVKVDLIVRKNTPYRLEEFGRRRRVRIDGRTIWIVAAEDLVPSKLVWMRDSGSEVQRRDVVALVQSVADLDREYIGRWAESLGVTERWREVSSGI